MVSLYSNQIFESFVAQLLFTQVISSYRDNYHIVMNLVCNNRDRQCKEYFISHITNVILHVTKMICQCMRIMQTNVMDINKSIKMSLNTNFT